MAKFHTESGNYNILGILNTTDNELYNEICGFNKRITNENKTVTYGRPTATFLLKDIINLDIGRK
jgi:hypothetical protein